MKTKILSIAFAFFAISLQAQETIPMPKPGPAPTINIGKPNEFKLKNGLNVIVVENHKLPRVTASLSIDNPPFALGSKKGAESLLSELLGTGTKKLSKDEFNNRIEFLGATVGIHNSGASASSLKKYFEEVFGYMADGALNPEFSQEEFEAVKARYIEALKTNEKSVEKAAIRVQDILIYGENHPYAEYDSQEKIQAITLQDVKDYYNTYYKPNNAYLVVVGDITTKEVKKLADKYLSKWKSSNLSIPAFPKVDEVKKTVIDVINMPNAVQSVVSVSYPVHLTKSDPDYYAVQVASTILGGDFNSKLNMNLREKNSFAYGAYGGVSDSRYIGSFYTNATVRNDVTDKAVVETMKEIRSMLTDKIDAKDLEDIKAKFLGNFILKLENPFTIANQALVTKTNKLPSSFYSDYLKNINNVTPEDVLRVSKKYFRPDQARIIVTGKAEQIGDGLEKLGYPVTYYDSYANIIEKPKASSQTTNVTVAQISDNYFKAIGGLDKAKSVKSIIQKGKIETMGMSGDFELKTASPNKTSQILSIAGMKIKQGFDGKKGFFNQGGGNVDLPEELTAHLPKTNALFAPLSEAYKEAKVEGIVKEDGKELYKVVISSINRTDYYEVTTGLLYKTEQMLKTPQGEVVSTMIYSVYKSFDGVQIPVEFTSESMGQTGKVTISAVEINKNVSDADFK